MAILTLLKLTFNKFVNSNFKTDNYTDLPVVILDLKSNFNYIYLKLEHLFIIIQ